MFLLFLVSMDSLVGSMASRTKNGSGHDGPRPCKPVSVKSPCWMPSAVKMIRSLRLLGDDFGPE